MLMLVRPQIVPNFKELNFLRNIGCVAYYDLASARGSKVFNLMKGNPPFANLVPFDIVDTDENGIINGWDATISGSPVGNFAIDIASQKIDITTATVQFEYKGIMTTSFSATAPSEVITFGLDAKIAYAGNMRCSYFVRYYTSADVFVSGANAVVALTNGADFVDKTITVTVPTTSTIAKFKLEFNIYENAVGGGSVGSLWLKNLKVVKAYTLEPTDTDGIVTGATLSPYGKIFDGIDDAIVIPNSEALNFTNKLTIGAYFSLATLPQHGYLFFRGMANIIQYALLYHSAGYAVGYVNNTAFASSAGIVKGTGVYSVWFTWDGTNTKLYVFSNGVSLVYSGSYSTSPGNYSYTYIGCRDAGSGNRSIFFKGMIGKELVFNRALTNVQVTQLHKMYAPFYGIPS